MPPATYTARASPQDFAEIIWKISFSINAYGAQPACGNGPHPMQRSAGRLSQLVLLRGRAGGNAAICSWYVLQQKEEVFPNAKGAVFAIVLQFAQIIRGRLTSCRQQWWGCRISRQKADRLRIRRGLASVQLNPSHLGRENTHPRTE